MTDDIRSVRPVGDVNGDGLDDFVGRRGDALLALIGGAEGPVEVPAPFSTGSEEEERTARGAGDADCDGYEDVLVRRHVRGGPDRIALHRGSPDGIATRSTWEVAAEFDVWAPIFD